MRQIVLDTETTGLEPEQGHRIIEIGCVELINRRKTGRTFHRYLRPDGEIDRGAEHVHGLTNEFLAQQQRFADVVEELLEFLSVPFAFAFGLLADRIGAKRSIYLALVVYVCITVLAYWLRTIGQFFAFAFAVAMVMGGVQALSRSLFAVLIPRHKTGEMFGFFRVFDRFGGAIGSFLFGLMLAPPARAGRRSSASSCCSCSVPCSCRAWMSRVAAAWRGKPRPRRTKPDHADCGGTSHGRHAPGW